MNVTFEKKQLYFTSDILNLLHDQYRYAIIKELASIEDIGDSESAFITFDEFNELKEFLHDEIDFDEEICLNDNFEDYENDDVLLQNIYSSRAAYVYKSCGLNLEEYNSLIDSIKEKISDL